MKTESAVKQISFDVLARIFEPSPYLTICTRRTLRQFKLCINRGLSVAREDVMEARLNLVQGN
jgi:hypothetical protein